MMTREAEVPSHDIFRLLLGFCSSFWDSGSVGREEQRGDRVCTLQTLLKAATLCQTLPGASHFPFPLLSVEWRTEAPPEESTAVLLSTSVLTELTSFFPSCPLLPTSTPALMSQTWLNAPICSQAHRSVKSSCYFPNYFQNSCHRSLIRTAVVTLSRTNTL